MDVKLKVFTNDDNKDFGQVQNLTNWRGRFQTNHEIEQLVGPCSREHCERGTLASSSVTNNIRTHGWTTQTVSQGGLHRGLNKQNDLCDFAAMKCGQVREFFCSSPIVCKEEGGREVSTNCLCELQRWKNYLFTWGNEFCIR